MNFVLASFFFSLVLFLSSTQVFGNIKPTADEKAWQKIVAEIGEVVTRETEPQVYDFLESIVHPLFDAQVNYHKGNSVSSGHVKKEIRIYLIRSEELNAFVYEVKDKAKPIRIAVTDTLISELFNFFKALDSKENAGHFVEAIAGIISHELAHPIEKQMRGNPKPRFFGLGQNHAVEVRSDKIAVRILQEAGYPETSLLKGLNAINQILKKQLADGNSGNKTPHLYFTHPEMNLRLMINRLAIVHARREFGSQPDIDSVGTLNFPIQAKKKQKAQDIPPLNLEQAYDSLGLKPVDNFDDIMKQFYAIKEQSLDLHPVRLKLADIMTSSLIDAKDLYAYLFSHQFLMLAKWIEANPLGEGDTQKLKQLADFFIEYDNGKYPEFESIPEVIREIEYPKSENSPTGILIAVYGLSEEEKAQKRIAYDLVHPTRVQPDDLFVKLINQNPAFLKLFQSNLRQVHGSDYFVPPQNLSKSRVNPIEPNFWVSYFFLLNGVYAERHLLLQKLSKPGLEKLFVQDFHKAYSAVLEKTEIYWPYLDENSSNDQKKRRIGHLANYTDLEDIDEYLRRLRRPLFLDLFVLFLESAKSAGNPFRFIKTVEFNPALLAWAVVPELNKRLFFLDLAELGLILNKEVLEKPTIIDRQKKYSEVVMANLEYFAFSGFFTGKMQINWPLVFKLNNLTEQVGYQLIQDAIKTHFGSLFAWNQLIPHLKIEEVRKLLGRRDVGFLYYQDVPSVQQGGQAWMNLSVLNKLLFADFLPLNANESLSKQEKIERPPAGFAGEENLELYRELVLLRIAFEEPRVLQDFFAQQFSVSYKEGIYSELTLEKIFNSYFKNNLAGHVDSIIKYKFRVLVAEAVALGIVASNLSGQSKAELLSKIFLQQEFAWVFSKAAPRIQEILIKSVPHYNVYNQLVKMNKFIKSAIRIDGELAGYGRLNISNADDFFKNHLVFISEKIADLIKRADLSDENKAKSLYELNGILKSFQEFPNHFSYVHSKKGGLFKVGIQDEIFNAIKTLNLSFGEKINAYLKLTEVDHSLESERYLADFILKDHSGLMKLSDNDLKNLILNVQGAHHKADLTEMFIDRMNVLPNSFINQLEFKKFLKLINSLMPDASFQKDQILEKIAWKFGIDDLTQLDQLEELKAFSRFQHQGLTLMAASYLISSYALELSASERLALVEFFASPHRLEISDVIIAAIDRLDKIKTYVSHKRFTYNAKVELVEMQGKSWLDKLPVIDLLLSIGEDPLIENAEFRERGVYGLLGLDPNEAEGLAIKAYLKADAKELESTSLAYLLARNSEALNLEKSNLRDTFELFQIIGKKAGQGAHTWKLVGPEHRESLRDLKDHGSPMDKIKIIEIVKSELGQEGFKKVKKFKRVLSAGSIKTVVEVELTSGENIVLMVKDPYAERQIYSMQKLVWAYLNELKNHGLVPGDRFIESLYQSIMAQINDELDFSKEAEKTRMVQVALERIQQSMSAGDLKNWQLSAPSLHPEFSPSSHLLAFSKVEGESFDRIGALEQKETGPILVETFFKLMFEHGLIDGDRHVGNQLIDVKDRTIHLLDFGQLQSIDVKGSAPSAKWILSERYSILLFLVSLRSRSSENLLKSMLSMIRSEDLARFSEAERSELLRSLKELFANPNFSVQDHLIEVVKTFENRGFRLDPKYSVGFIKGLLTIYGEDYVPTGEFEKRLVKVITPLAAEDFRTYAQVSEKDILKDLQGKRSALRVQTCEDFFKSE